MTRIKAGAWLNQARVRLSGHERPLSEAQAVLSAVLGWSRAKISAHPERVLTEKQREALDEALACLAAGMPLPYIMGHWGFYGLDLLVTPDVLIPRPETELLVETALDWLRQNPGRRMADVGAGSGCISVALAANCPGLQGLMIDRSFAALQVARQNTYRRRLSKWLCAVQADLLTACSGPFDLVCANLPYIPSETLAGLPVAQYEPRLALDGGPDGLDLIRPLLADAPRWLAPGGLLLLEIEARQGAAVTALARQAFPSAAVSLIADLAGHDRLVAVQC